MPTYQHYHINKAGTYIIKTDNGFLHSIVVNTTAAGAITVYDNTSAAEPIIAVLKSNIGENTYTFDVNFITGLTIVTAAASDITVSYS